MKLNLNYDVLNEENTFSAGDTVAGSVTLTLEKETGVKSIAVKVRGDANVHWTEGTGDHKKTYRSHRRYFKAKEYLVAENPDGIKLPEGIHCFKFRLQIPQGDMPSSFFGHHGNIVYMLEAKLTRSWWLPHREQKELKFVSNSFPHHSQVMCPQSGSVDKEMGIFSKGHVQMSATVDRKVCSPGDTLSVVANVCNSSSKKMKFKYSLHQKTVYRATTKTRVSDTSVCKIVGDTIAPNSKETASCNLKIPDNIFLTLHNCDILSVDFYLKVYLDISFKFDPEVLFPLIIVPSSIGNLHPGEAMGPHPAGAAWAPSNSDFPSSAFPFSAPAGPSAGPAPAFAVPFGPYPAPASPGTYGYPAPVPTRQASITSGYNNQLPQQAPPYSYPAAPFPPSSVLNQAPTAPPLSEQEEAPPTYSSLFPPSYDFLGSTESDNKS